MSGNLDLDSDSDSDLEGFKVIDTTDMYYFSGLRGITWRTKPHICTLSALNRLSW